MPAVTEPHPETISTAKITCPSCQTTESWGSSTWCPQCGYYPTLNSQLKLDQLELQETEEQVQSPLDHLQNLPAWVWLLTGGFFAVFVMSILARVVIVPANPERAWWAGIQFGIGFSILTIAHLIAYTTALTYNSTLGPIDIVMKPFTIWQAIISRLPRRSMLLCWGTWGLTAAICGLVVIGGIDYDALLAKFAPRKKADSSVTEAIAENVSPAETSGSMEDGMNEFTKGANVDNLNKAQALSDQQKKDQEQKEIEPVNIQEAEQLLTAECLIIGYTLNNNQLNTLLLATIVDRKLKFVGHLTADAIPEDARKELSFRVRKYPRNHPVVKCSFDAEWLEPVLMCLVSYNQATPQNRLIGIELLELLQDVSQN